MFAQVKTPQTIMDTDELYVNITWPLENDKKQTWITFDISLGRYKSTQYKQYFKKKQRSLLKYYTSTAMHS